MLVQHSLSKVHNRADLNGCWDRRRVKDDGECGRGEQASTSDEECPVGPATGRGRGYSNWRNANRCVMVEWRNQ